MPVSRVVTAGGFRRYVATEARPGTGDVWAINPLVTQMPGSGEYAAQGIELDFNNNNAHRGDADGGAGLAFPVSYGLVRISTRHSPGTYISDLSALALEHRFVDRQTCSAHRRRPHSAPPPGWLARSCFPAVATFASSQSITGAGSFRSTAALLVCGEVGMWNRGIVFANNAVNQSTFQDLGSPHTSVDIRGSPTYGVYQTSPTAKNVFAGGTAVAADDPAGYQLRVGGAASAHSRWTDADATAVAGVAVDAVLSGDVLGMLAKLEPKRWRRRNGTGAIGDAGMGFLAQDVEQAVPAELAKALVRTGGDGRKSISYERLAAVAIAGLRQSARKVDSLEQRVQVAENDRNKMARRVARLEQQMDLFLTFF